MSKLLKPKPKTEDEQDLNFFSDDSENTLSKTQYISKAVLYLSNKKIHIEFEKLLIILLVAACFFGSLKFAYLTVFEESPTQKLEYTSYTNLISKISEEQVNSYFTSVDTKINEELDSYISVYSKILVEKGEHPLSAQNIKDIYEIGELNYRNNLERRINLVTQIQNPEIIKNLSSSERKHYQKIISHISLNIIDVKYLYDIQLQRYIIERKALSKYQSVKSIKKENTDKKSESDTKVKYNTNGEKINI